MITEQHPARNRLCLAGKPLALSKNIKLYLREEEKDPSQTTDQVGPREWQDNGRVVCRSAKG